MSRLLAGALAVGLPLLLGCAGMLLGPSMEWPPVIDLPPDADPEEAARLLIETCHQLEADYDVRQFDCTAADAALEGTVPVVGEDGVKRGVHDTLDVAMMRQARFGVLASMKEIGARHEYDDFSYQRIGEDRVEVRYVDHDVVRGDDYDLVTVVGPDAKGHWRFLSQRFTWREE